MRLLRALVISLGLGLLGLFGLVELVLRRRSEGFSPSRDGEGEGADAVAGTAGPPVSRALSRVRTALGAVGVAIALYGGFLVLRTVPWTSYLPIAIWLAAAVVLHDAVLVPAVSALRATTIRAGRRLPAASLALVQGALVVGGVLSLVAVPEIWAKHLGPLNATVLPGSYGLALLATWVLLAAITAGSVTTHVLLARRHTARRLEPAE